MSMFIDPATALQASQTALQIIKDTVQICRPVVTELFQLSQELVDQLKKLLPKQQEGDGSPANQKSSKQQQSSPQPLPSLTKEDEKLVNRIVAIAAIQAIRQQGEPVKTATGESLLQYRSPQFTVIALPDAHQTTFTYHLYSNQAAQSVSLFSFQESLQDNRVILFATHHSLPLEAKIALIDIFRYQYEQSRLYEQTQPKETIPQAQVSQPDAIAPASQSQPVQPQDHPSTPNSPSPPESSPSQESPTQPDSASHTTPATQSPVMDRDMEVVLRAHIYVAQKMPNSPLFAKDRVTKDSDGTIQIDKGAKVGKRVLTLGMSAAGTLYAARHDLAIDQQGNLQTANSTPSKAPAVIYQSEASGRVIANRLAEARKLVPEVMNVSQVAQTLREQMPRLKQEMAQAKAVEKTGSIPGLG